MRAVNLIPTDQRRAGGASTTGAYAVLGLLVALLVGVVAYVVTGNQMRSRQAQLATLSQEATAAQAAADAAAPYRGFASLRQQRVATISAIASARFDWADAFYKIAQVMPSDVSLLSLNASTSTSSAGGNGGPLRADLPVPAIDMTGCARSQDEVARVIARLRLIDSVYRVSLESSSKAIGSSTTSSSATNTSDCRAGHPDRPQFELVVFFNPPQSTTVPGGAVVTPASTSATGTAGTTGGSR